MSDNARHLHKFFSMAVVLLCLVICRAEAVTVDCILMNTADVVVAAHEGYESKCASFSEKEDNMLHAARETEQWGIPAVSVTLQGTTGRVLTLSEALQRINRMLSALLACAPSSSNGVAEALRHTLSTKRFYSGYYIYFRCQMRC